MTTIERATLSSGLEGGYGMGSEAGAGWPSADRYHYQLRASVGQGKLKLWAVRGLKLRLKAGGLTGPWRTEDSPIVALAFTLVRCDQGATVAGDGRFGMPYDDLCKGAARLYELLEGTHRWYPLTAQISDPHTIDVWFPDKETFLRGALRT